MSLPVSEKLILRQINHWSNLRATLQQNESTTPSQKKPVITISRLAGSGGRSLACDLSKRLSLDLQDQSMVQRIVKDRNLEKSLVTELDENTISQTRLWVKGILNQRTFMKDQYHRDLVRVVSKLAARGGVLFLGRGANLILGEEADLRVRVVASKRTRVSNLRNRLDLSLAEARVLVEETDAKRRDFVRQVFRQEPGQGENYDLVLNGDRLSLESMSALVIQALMECSVRTQKNQMASQG
jgi:cytidylate kinase